MSKKIIKIFRLIDFLDKLKRAKLNQRDVNALAYYYMSRLNEMLLIQMRSEENY